MNELNLNKNIAELRKAAGLTQEQLANQLGISYQAVSKWENSQSCPDVMLLPRLAEIFDISIDALFGIERTTTAIVPVPDELPWADDEGIYAVIYQGHRLITEAPLDLDRRLDRIPLVLRGTPKNVTSVLSVQVDGNVSGDVSAGGSVACDNIGGCASAGGNVTCDDIRGSVEAGGSVACDDIWGDVNAGGRVSCDTVKGSVYAAGGVNCDEGCFVGEDFHGIHGSFTIDKDDLTPEQREKYDNLTRNGDKIADSALGLADRIIGRVSKTLDNIFK